jgi:hypothetical protein
MQDVATGVGSAASLAMLAYLLLAA